MIYWQVHFQGSKSKRKNIWEAGKKKSKSNMVHCRTATEEMYLVVRSCRMSPERLQGTLKLESPTEIWAYLFPNFLLYCSKSKELSPGNFQTAAGKARVSPCQLVMSICSLGFSTTGLAYALAKVPPKQKAREVKAKARAGRWWLEQEDRIWSGI